MASYYALGGLFAHLCQPATAFNRGQPLECTAAYSPTWLCLGVLQKSLDRRFSGLAGMAAL
jgi:hypothetical protein